MLGFAVALGACAGSSDSTAPEKPAALAGVWLLSSINGHPLPYSLPADATGKIDVTLKTTQTFDTNGGFTYIRWRYYGTPAPGTLVATDSNYASGTYVLRGDSVITTTATIGSDGTSRAIVLAERDYLSGNQLTGVDVGVTYVFTKQ